MSSGGVRFNIFAFDKTKRAFQSVNNNLNGLQKKMSGLKNSFGGIGKAMVAAFAVAGVSAIVKTTDEIEKFSRRLGTSTAALSELKFAGEQTGVAFNQLAIGMQRATRRISEAAQGAGEAQGALKELGLDAIELNNLSPDQQFMKIADALEGVEKQSDKVRLAFKLFDSEGVALIQTMEGGSAAVQKLRDELNDLNGVVDSQSAQAMASLNDSWNRFTVAIEGAGRQLLTFFAPVLEAIIDTITMLVSWIGKLVKGLRWLQHAAAKAIVRFSEFVGIIEESKADEMVGKISAQWDEIANGTKAAGNAVDTYRQKVEEAEGALGKMKRKTPGGGGSTGGKKSPKDEADSIKDSVEGIGTTTEEIGDTIKDTFKDAIRSAGDDFTSLEDMARNTYDRIKSSLLDKAADTLTGAIFGGKNGGGLLDSIFGGGGGGSILDGIFGGGGGGSGFSSFLNGASSFFGGFFADGGQFQGGKPIVVGERGPEMILPRSAGSVIPNEKMNAGGRPMNVSININTPDANSFRQSEGQITAQMAMALDRATRNL